MQNGNWIGIDKRLSSLLPKKRAFTEIEAYISLQIDIDNYAHKIGREPQAPDDAIGLLLSQVSIAAYASLWRWSWNKTSRFIRDLGTNTGYLAVKKGRNKGKPIRLIINNLLTLEGTKRENRGDKEGTSYNPQSQNQNKKNKYGEFVLLTNEEHEKLINQFGEKGTQDRIETLNIGIGSKGYKYRSHYHAILSWEKKSIKTEVKKTIMGGLAY